MRRAAALALCALAAAGCGDEERARTATPPVATTESEAPPPAGKQKAESRKQRTTEEADDVSAPPSKPYRCDGNVLRALKPMGRVRIEPNPVDAGERFDVVITDRRAEVAVVSLAGVSDVPIRADARRSGRRLVATLRMPAEASCGNKLVTVEGDLAAQAYVAVRR